MMSCLSVADRRLIEAVATMDAEKEAMGYDAQQHRRLQCRKSQKSFRDRKKKEHEAIITTVTALQDEVAALQQRAASLVRQVPLVHVLRIQPDFDGGPTAKMARQYITLFKQGYNSSRRKLSVKQANFLTAVAVPHVRYDHGVGVQCILDNWQRYTSSFSSVSMEMHDCVVTKTDDGAIVKGVVKSFLKISRNSISTFFPYCPDHLKSRLVGQVMTVYATMHWCFDEDDHLVALTGNADFTSALLSILHDIDAVAAVLNQAAFKHIPEEPVAPPQKKMDLSYIT
ncbi:hypothetical protein SPRG_03873 [Saprolegnia parasitica CBS 223.65]|uniref:BZIP domain-containing protein n=1 Tax=Saprolegnia parasitica (strain CBS 223.65) TaxID=695850 RepID=A0A067CWU4_SAPPC|nr:hypothetical protein SPRG_03873 [Saprolegnia parasitica CBS 223.65]KDO31257.1 hypothetical protein SPRG_03873 [Saprolegnia parasitica CBS 223.65]|eukprot:XP_012197858.1 hypothetical protein SPRG_03873 [Saprolegnia parasitica CBS 223.65]